MKNKKILHGFMAGVLAIGLIAPISISFIAKADSLENGRVGWYTFDDGTLKNAVDDSTATAVIQGLGAYSGDVIYDTNRANEEGKSIRLKDYGLKLNKQNLGDDFSVSLWLKPDGVMNENQSVMFLGYHNPEKWYAIAGNKNSSANCKVWAHGNGYDNWNTFSTVDITATKWHHVVLEGTADNMTAYFDGKQVATGVTNAPMKGTNQDIYIGVTNWDPAFAGVVDDIMVYDRTLTEGEIERIYTDKKPSQILEEEGITVADIKMPVGRTAPVDVTIPEAVLEENPSIKYEVEDKSIVSIDKDGIMTALQAGETKISVSVSLGSVKKTTEAKVTVDAMDKFLTASYTFEGNYENQINGGVNATAVNRPGPDNGIENYTGTVNYASGRNGQAIDLQDYGLKLNQQNLGKDYTISFWLQPKAVLVENQVVLNLGYHNPEKWIAISGYTQANQCKIWGNGGNLSYQYMFYPEVPAEEWSQLTITGTPGKMSAYLNGILIGATTSNDPLDGENQDIYIGVNNWDLELNGLVDDLKVYNIALTQEEIQQQMTDSLQAILQERLESEVSIETVLGDNESVDAIKYDLVLPKMAANLQMEWTSSDEKVISAEGSISTPDKDTKVNLTGTITSGVLQASVSYELNVLALDRTSLDELILKAEAIQTDNMVESSVARLQDAIKEAKAANTFAQIETAYERLNIACESMCYVEDFMDPFAYITDSVVETSVAVGDKSKVFEVPAQIVDAVDVQYVVENESTATYTDGTIEGVAAGQTVVTAVVTAKYDGWKMEYSTAITVTAKQATVTPTPGTTDTNQTVTSGNTESSSKKTSSSSKKNNTTKETTTDNGTANALTNQDTTLIQNEATPLTDGVQATDADASEKDTTKTSVEARNNNNEATATVNGKEVVDNKTETETIKDSEVAKADTPETEQAQEKVVGDTPSQNDAQISAEGQNGVTRKSNPLPIAIAGAVAVVAVGGSGVVFMKRRKK